MSYWLKEWKGVVLVIKNDMVTPYYVSGGIDATKEEFVDSTRCFIAAEIDGVVSETIAKDLLAREEGHDWLHTVADLDGYNSISELGGEMVVVVARKTKVLAQ